jgi:hypothetical protein
LINPTCSTHVREATREGRQRGRTRLDERQVAIVHAEMGHDQTQRQELQGGRNGAGQVDQQCGNPVRARLLP